MLRLLASSIGLLLSAWLVSSPALAADKLAADKLADGTAGTAGAATTPYRIDHPSKSIDVALGEQGVLRGTVLDRQGRVLVDTQVELLNSRGTLAKTKTNGRGQFGFSHLPSGVAALRVGQQLQKLRLWRANIAPPSARDQVLFVTGSTVRAQCAGDPCAGCDACGSAAPVGFFGGIFQCIVQNPWIVATGTAAAIAIPLATDDDDAS